MRAYEKGVIMPKLRNISTGEERELSYDFEGIQEANKLRMNGWIEVFQYKNPFEDNTDDKPGY